MAHLRLALSQLAATAPQSAPVLFRRSAVCCRRDTRSLRRAGRAAGWRAAGRGRLRQRHGGRARGDRRTGRQARQRARRAGARRGARRVRGILPRRGALQARARVPRDGGAGRGRAGALPLHRYGARPRSRRSGCEAVLAGRSGPVAGACRRAACDAGRRLRRSGRWGHWRDVGKVRRGPWRVHGRRSAGARSCLLAFAPRGPCSAVSVRARAGAGMRAGGRVRPRPGRLGGRVSPRGLRHHARQRDRLVRRPPAAPARSISRHAHAAACPAAARGAGIRAATAAARRGPRALPTPVRAGRAGTATRGRTSRRGSCSTSPGRSWRRWSTCRPRAFCMRTWCAAAMLQGPDEAHRSPPSQGGSPVKVAGGRPRIDDHPNLPLPYPVQGTLARSPAWRAHQEARRAAALAPPRR
jgi:hypothetical protein